MKTAFVIVIATLVAMAGRTCLAQTDPDHHGSITGAYEYLDAQGSSGQYTSLHGFDVVPALAISKNTDVFFSFNGFYKQREHVNGFTGGPLYKLHAIGRVTPLGFTEIGSSRTSLSGTVTNAFTFVLGGGILIKLDSHVSLELIPAEYVLTLPHGNIATNYNALVGFSIPVGHRK